MSHDPTRCYVCEGIANDLYALRQAMREAMDILDGFNDTRTGMEAIRDAYATLSAALQPEGTEP